MTNNELTITNNECQLTSCFLFYVFVTFLIMNAQHVIVHASRFPPAFELLLACWFVVASCVILRSIFVLSWRHHLQIWGWSWYGFGTSMGVRADSSRYVFLYCSCLQSKFVRQKCISIALWYFFWCDCECRLEDKHPSMERIHESILWNVL